MAKDEIGDGRYSDMEIAQMFSDYVTRMADKPRHTAAAIKEADAFDTFCGSEFPRNVMVQNGLFERMMNVAVEYEESGFIAGFKTAMAMLAGNESAVPVSTLCHMCAETAQERISPDNLNNSTLMAKKWKNGAITKPQAQGSGRYISTRRIAKMFGTPNWKIVKRIERQILPECTEEDKDGFYKCIEKNEQHRNTDVYRLNYRACLLYCQYISRLKKFENVKNGLAVMKEAMAEVFCCDYVA